MNGVRHNQRIRWARDLIDDIRYALRVTAKSPRYALSVALTVAVGISATTVVFSVVNAVVLKPLPYPQPDRIVLLGNRSTSGVQPGISAPRFLVWRDATRVFDHPAAYALRGSMTLRRGTGVEPVVTGRVSVEFFQLFGASLIAGREFTVDEDRPAAARVVVLG